MGNQEIVAVAAQKAVKRTLTALGVAALLGALALLQDPAIGAFVMQHPKLMVIWPAVLWLAHTVQDYLAHRN